MTAAFFAYTYRFFYDLNYVISSRVEDWAHFGTYFSGILGPILNFLTIILLVYSMDMQLDANKALREDLEENKKNEKIRNFESLFFNMLDRQHSSFSTMNVVLIEDGEDIKYFGSEAVSKIEEIVEGLIGADVSSERIIEIIEKIDSHDGIYSQFRCFYLAINFIEEYLSQGNGFNELERKKYYKALINFTEYSQVRVMAMFLQFMFQRYENVKAVRNNKEFEEVFVDCGLGFDIYKK
ncbi:MAG: hypothetical protein LBV14_15555 [Acidovorax sp.]|jgi:hypothetical protein|nr:hypothetical protein [Acidovorax sp.]